MDIKNCTPVLFVRDAQKARNFYEGILGLTVVGDFGGLNIMFKERFALWQIMDENIIPRTLGKEEILNSSRASRFELVFETENLDKIYTELKAQNVEFLHEINEELWGQRTIRFYDPDGHLVEVGEAMHVFVRRVYEAEGKNIEAAAKKMYMEPEILRQILGL